MHPEQYKMGLVCMERLPLHCEDMDILDLWCSLFNGVQVISNRETPVHRDNGTLSPWMDLLATVGPYTTATFVLPGVGVKFLYGSGTVMGICGRLLRHLVTDVRGERICLAYYMKTNVQARVEVTPAGWSHI